MVFSRNRYKERDTSDDDDEESSDGGDGGGATITSRNGEASGKKRRLTDNVQKHKARRRQLAGTFNSVGQRENKRVTMYGRMNIYNTYITATNKDRVHSLRRYPPPWSGGENFFFHLVAQYFSPI